MTGSTVPPRRWSSFWRTGLLPGALAGVAGGLVFGIAMLEVGQLPDIAGMARTNSSLVGFIVLMVGMVILGAGFGGLVWLQQPQAGETLFWGLVYGVFWWYLGTLTLLPLLRGDGASWGLDTAQASFSALPGLVLYGGTLALGLVFLRLKQHYRDKLQQVTWGVLLRGGLAGLFAAGLLGSALNSQGRLLASFSMSPDGPVLAAWLVVLATGLLAGLGFSLLYPRTADGAGPGLVRGTVYGFFWWVLASLTVVPLIALGGLTWSVAEVRAIFPTLPGFLLFGAGIALFYHWLGGLVDLLFSDMIGGGDEEGVGTQGLRIVGRSAVAGLVGGLLFSLVMYQIGFLKYVADLIGADSPVVGFLVHLSISILVGTSYGVLFHRQTYDLGSALGWGVSYGFFWSILGPVTLMPIFLGSTPQWSLGGVTSAFPNLIGHLAYGAALAIVFYLLEARFSPWWIPRRQAQAARVARRKEQVLTSAPALWTLLVGIGLTLPVVLGG